MSDTFKMLTNASVAGSHPESLKRAVAVATALELISVKLSAHSYHGAFKDELENLSEYADLIQSAANPK